jgi:hypothetical protein
VTFSGGGWSRYRYDYLETHADINAYVESQADLRPDPTRRYH